MVLKKKFLLILLCFVNISAIDFTIIVLSYNNERYVYRNLDSLIHQKTHYPFHIMYINDCSTDTTGTIVDTFIKHYQLESLITVIHNTERVGALANLYKTIHSCPDDSIIVVVDGDDFLAHDQVIEKLGTVYDNSPIWLTYGQFLYYPEGVLGICKELPEDIVQKNAFRHYDWVTSHLKTFYAKLFKQIKLDDLQYEGEFFPMANDVAMMLPMLEMASKGHIYFISDVLYVYNHHNPLSNHTKNRDLQLELTMVTYNRPPYKPLESLF